MSATQARGRDCDGCTQERVKAEYVAMLNSLPCNVPHGDPAYSCLGYSKESGKSIYKHGQLCTVEAPEEEKKACENCCKPKCTTCSIRQACVYTYFCAKTGDELEECPNDFCCLSDLAMEADVEASKPKYTQVLIGKCVKLTGWNEEIVDEVTCISGWLCPALECSVWEIYALGTAQVGDWIKIGDRPKWVVTEESEDICPLTDLSFATFCQGIEISTNSPSVFGLSIDEGEPSPFVEIMFSRVRPQCKQEYRNVLTTSPYLQAPDERAGGCACEQVTRIDNSTIINNVVQQAKSEDVELYVEPECTGDCL